MRIGQDSLDSLITAGLANTNDPKTGFCKVKADIIAFLDSQNADVEIKNPNTWRLAVTNNIKHYIMGMKVLPVDEERLIAQKIEICKERYEQAITRAMDSSIILRRMKEWESLKLELIERSLHMITPKSNGTITRYDWHARLSDTFILVSSLVDKYDWRGAPFKYYITYAVKSAGKNEAREVAKHARVDIEESSIVAPENPDNERYSVINNYVPSILDMLPERDKRIVCMRYGIGFPECMTLSDIAQIEGVSLERIRQIQERAMSKLKSSVVDFFNKHELLYT